MFACTTGLVGTAGAQTAVTVYGVVDAGIERVDHLPSNGGSATRLVSGGEAGSRLGFRGREDLGGGLYALFTLESGFNVDTGTFGQGGRAFGRNAQVGIGGPFGRLTAGRQVTAIYDLAVLFDPLGRASRYSMPSLDPAYAARVDNSIRYELAAGPAKATLMYAAGEIDGSSRANRYLGADASARWGRLSLGAGYERQNGAEPAAAGDSVRRTMVAGAWDFGPMKAVAGWTLRRSSLAAFPRRTHHYWAGVNAQLSTAWYAALSWYAADDRDASGDSQLVSFFSSYALSKRTDVYLHLAYADNQGEASMGVAGQGTVQAGASQTGVLVGLRHSF